VIGFIVPVNDEEVLANNLRTSPGLCFHEVTEVREATSAADAFYAGVKAATADWIVYVHQDVVLPVGACAALNLLTKTVKPEDAPTTIIGFCGIGYLANGTLDSAGTLWDRKKLLDWPRSDKAISIDEYCVLVNRGLKYFIDARLGWHLWATDLCLQALNDGHPARIERLLMRHNSTLGKLPPEFYHSAEILRAKYPTTDIRTLNGL